MSQKLFHVNSDEVGMRLDRYLNSKNIGLTQGLIQKYLRLKNIKVNGKKAESNLRLQENDEIVVKVFDDLVPREKYEKVVAPEKVAEFKSQIIFEDVDVIAINKKAGQAVQGGMKIRESLDDVAIAYTKSEEARLVHRLDQDTSGVLVIAKNRKTASELAASFKGKDVDKTYIALCSGVPEVSKGVITMPITHDNKRQNAESRYEVVTRFGSEACLIKFYPITGRKHQIRIHAKAIGCPVVNDKKYNPNEKPSFLNSDQLMLHCLDIALILNNKPYNFHAKAPKDFGDVY